MRRLTILIAAVGALLLVPAAQAFAGTMTANIASVEGGAGEISSVEGSGIAGLPPGSWEGTPPLECHGPPKTGQCTSEMDEEVIVMEAIADPGSEFLGWSGVTIEGEEGEVVGGCGGPVKNEVGNYDCAIFAEGNAEVTAEFGIAPPQKTLTFNIEEGKGSVVSNPAGLICSGTAPTSCETEFEEGSTVTLTASPSGGYLFKSWKGCDSGGVNGRQCKVTLSADKTVGAKFFPAFELSAEKSGPSGSGIVSTSPGGINCGYLCTSSKALYKEGALTIKAKPAKHFHFVKFQSGSGAATACNGVTTDCTIANFNANSFLQAVFAADTQYTLQLLKNGGGGQALIKTKPTNINCGFTCIGESASFYAGEKVIVSWKLNKGTTELTWISPFGTCTGTFKALEGSCEVTVSEAKSLSAKLD